jgi:hypothetical protein
MSPLVCVSAKDTGGEAAPYCFLKNEKKISRIYRTDVAQSQRETNRLDGDLGSLFGFY